MRFAHSISGVRPLLPAKLHVDVDSLASGGDAKGQKKESEVGAAGATTATANAASGAAEKARTVVAKAPRRLQWSLPTEVKAGIQAAEAQVSDLIMQVGDLVWLECPLWFTCLCLCDCTLRSSAHPTAFPAQNETRVLEFKDYGKRFIVAHRMSPDAFAQIAMMVAYFRM